MKMKELSKKIEKLKTMSIWGMLMLIFIVQLFFYTWCRIQCIRMGYEISKEADHRRELLTLQNNLKIELAHLKSPDRIAEIAKSQLNLAMPDPEQIVIIP